MHKELGSWVTLPCHIHLGGALKMIKIEYMHSSPKIQVFDHTQTFIEIDMQEHIKHSMIKHMITQGISRECRIK